MELKMAVGDEQVVSDSIIRITSIAADFVTLHVQTDTGEESIRTEVRHKLRNELFALEIAIGLIRDELQAGLPSNAMESVQQALNQMKSVHALISQMHEG